MRNNHARLLTLAHLRRLLVPMALVSHAVGGLSAAEPAAVTDATEPSVGPLVLPSEGEHPLMLPRASERRDIFYNLVRTEEAQVKLAELEANARGQDLYADDNATQSRPDKVDNAADPSQALRFAAQAISEVEGLMRDEAWEQAMNTAESHLSALRPHRATFPENAKLKESEATLQSLYVLAEDRKLYEEARAQFEALGLRIEGIMWSAEHASLALISGEPVARAINDRVRGTVIKSIDQNRVDFLYAYRQRQYHFQLYLEPKD